MAGSTVAASLAFVAAGDGAVLLAGVPGVAAVAFAFLARHWLALAERSRVGARSEDEVRRVLVPLRGDGWRLRHSLSWRGRGDIDAVAIAATGFAFAIERHERQAQAVHWHAQRQPRSDDGRDRPCDFARGGPRGAIQRLFGAV